MSNPSVYVQLPPNGAASWREAVSTATALPATGSLADERVAQDTQTNYIWSGSAWVSAGGTGGAITSINADTTAAQLISAASTGTNFTISTTAGTTTVAIPTASATNRGLLQSADWTTFNNKGSGSVTSSSVVSANGFAGTIANATSTPAITLSTSITGVLKGNGTALLVAASGTDYSLGTSSLATGILKSTTSTGALTIAVAADFPTLNQNTTGSAATVTTNANLTGVITSVGNATSTGAQTGTGNTFAMSASPTFTGIVGLANGSLAAPSTSWANSSTTGLYSSTAGDMSMSFAGAHPTDFGANYISIGKDLANSPPFGQGALYIYSPTVSTSYCAIGTGVDFLGTNITGLVIQNSIPLLVFNTNNNGFMMLNPAGYTGGPAQARFSFDFTYGSSLTAPVYTSSITNPPAMACLTMKNVTNTAGNFTGIQAAGSSYNVHAGMYMFCDTQTSGSEASHFEFHTAVAGTVNVKAKLLGSGQFALQASGTGLSIKTGSNCKMGTAVLVGGTVTVSNTAVTSSSLVFLTPQVAGGTQGVPTLGTVTAGTSFVINSSSALDTSTVAYLIMEPS